MNIMYRPCNYQECKNALDKYIETANSQKHIEKASFLKNIEGVK